MLIQCHVLRPMHSCHDHGALDRTRLLSLFWGPVLAPTKGCCFGSFSMHMGGWPGKVAKFPVPGTSNVVPFGFCLAFFEADRSSCTEQTTLKLQCLERLPCLNRRLGMMTIGASTIANIRVQYSYYSCRLTCLNMMLSSS